MYIPTFTPALYLALLVSCAQAASPEAPPAAQVLAEVHAASSLGSATITRIPVQGSLQDEITVCQHFAASGLGTVMGWGQDRFDNIDPSVVAHIVENFQRAFRFLERFSSGGTIDYPKVVAASRTLQGHFDAIRTVVSGGNDSTQRKRELHQLSKLLVHLTENSAGNPTIPSPRIGVIISLRTLAAGLDRLDVGLAPFPLLKQKLTGELASLRTLVSSPPSCSTSTSPGTSCLEEIRDRALPALQKVTEVTSP